MVSRSNVRFKQLLLDYINYNSYMNIFSEIKKATSIDYMEKNMYDAPAKHQSQEKPSKNKKKLHLDSSQFQFKVERICYTHPKE